MQKYILSKIYKGTKFTNYLSNFTSNKNKKIISDVTIR